MGATGDFQQDAVLAGLAGIGGGPGRPATTASRQRGQTADIASRIGRAQLQGRLERLGIGNRLAGLKAASDRVGIERIEAFAACRGVDKGEGGRPDRRPGVVQLA